MKFYESTSFFLRVVVVDYYSKSLDKRIRLIPMFHIGEISFYESVLKSANECDIVLYEGIQLKKKRISKQLGRYTKIAQKLGMTSQSEFFKLNKIKTKIKHADLNGLSAKNAWNQLKLSEKFKYRVIRPLTFRYHMIGITRQKLSKAFMTSAEDNHLAYGPIEEEGNLEFMTKRFRDNIVAGKIDETLQDSNNANLIGVMFGAGHMNRMENYITRQFDFKIQNTEFVIVYKL